MSTANVTFPVQTIDSGHTAWILVSMALVLLVSLLLTLLLVTFRHEKYYAPVTFFLALSSSIFISRGGDGVI